MRDLEAPQLILNLFAKLSSSWLVQSSLAKLRFALILVITLTHPTPRESSFEPLLDYLGS